MLKIKITDIINSKNAVSHGFGIKVYEHIHPFLLNKQPVTLSFVGLKNVTSGFANASIGKLFLSHKSASELLNFEGLNKNIIWQEKVQDAINLATNPEKIEKQNNAISELLYS